MQNHSLFGEHGQTVLTEPLTVSRELTLGNNGLINYTYNY